MPEFRLPADAPTVLGDYNSPDREWGGADPRSYESGDGTWFHGALEKDASGQLRLEVWRTDANGQIMTGWQSGGCWRGSGIVGQGGLVLQANGRLDAEGYIAQGDNATRRAIPVPDWQPHASGGGGGLSLAQAALLTLWGKVVALIKAS